MGKDITVHQAEIEVEGKKLTVTHIPTATSGCWYVVHDLFEMWGAVAIDMDGTVVGWRNPPDREDFKVAVEKAIREAFPDDIQQLDAEGQIIRDELLPALRKLEAVATELSNLYEAHPELNDQVDIQRIIPMSLDNWVSEIGDTIQRI